jgi:hypothetical protein
MGRSYLLQQLLLMMLEFSHHLWFLSGVALWIRMTISQYLGVFRLRTWSS